MSHQQPSSNTWAVPGWVLPDASPPRSHTGPLPTLMPPTVVRPRPPSTPRIRWDEIPAPHVSPDRMRILGQLILVMALMCSLCVSWLFGL